MDDKHRCKVRVVANRACETRGLQTSLAGMTTRMAASAQRRLEWLRRAATTSTPSPALHLPSRTCTCCRRSFPPSICCKLPWGLDRWAARTSAGTATAANRSPHSCAPCTTHCRWGPRLSFPQQSPVHYHCLSPTPHNGTIALRQGLGRVADLLPSIDSIHGRRSLHAPLQTPDTALSTTSPTQPRIHRRPPRPTLV